MSNACAPPSHVDALGAGGSGMQGVTSMFTMVVPIIMWSYVTPYIMSFVFPKTMIMIEDAYCKVPSQEEIDASMDTEFPLSAECPLVEAEAPNTWTETILKTLMNSFLMFFIFLLTLWWNQEGMLYIPDNPIKYQEQNPCKYKDPERRGMAYDEIWIETEDKQKLQGWFIKQKSEPEKQRTIIFLHENAGNLGLRNDWFELIYKRLGCNILAVAYRGYSHSEGHPDQQGLLLDADAIL